MTMLSLVVNLRPSTPHLALLGRELALVYAQAVFVPIIGAHIPGVANVTADHLSRQAQPGSPPRLGPVLGGARRRDVPLRDRNWYLTLNAEPPMSEQAG